MIKILHLSPHFYWPQLEKIGWPVKFDSMGGMQNQLFRQTHQLAKLGIHQVVLTLKVKNAPKIFQYNNKLTVFGVRIPILPLRSKIRGMIDLNLSWMLGVFAKFFFIKKENFSIIHTHGSGVGIPLLTGYILSRILKKPLVLTIHCSALATYQPMSYFDNFLWRINQIIEKKVLCKSNHIIFLTDKSLTICAQKVSGLENKSSIISDSIDSNYFCSLCTPEKKSYFLSKFPIPQDKFIICYIGRIAREKGWPNILRLAQQIKQNNDIHFLIVGNGNELIKMKKAVSRQKLHSIFTFTNYIPQEEVPIALEISSVLLLPSRHEEFGSIILEAMSMKTPVVAFNVGGVSKVIEHKKTGFLSDSFDQMLSFVQFVKDNPEKIAKILENAYLEVTKKYQTLTICENMKAVYSNVIISS